MVYEIADLESAAKFVRAVSIRKPLERLILDFESWDAVMKDIGAYERDGRKMSDIVYPNINSGGFSDLNILGIPVELYS